MKIYKSYGSSTNWRTNLKTYPYNRSASSRVFLSSILQMVLQSKEMAFGSHQGAETSTDYHTFMETCKMGALSFYKFLKNYLTAFMEGRTDFDNLTPAILGKIN